MATLKDDHQDMFGALVGWTHQDLGERVMIKLQSARQHLAEGDAPEEFHYLMTKNQAAVLGQYLFALSGRLPAPAKKRRWFG
ncbi:MAG: hypothetical protein ACEQR8_04715 [Cypionkella sp.]